MTKQVERTPVPHPRPAAWCAQPDQFLDLAGSDRSAFRDGLRKADTDLRPPLASYIFDPGPHIYVIAASEIVGRRGGETSRSRLRQRLSMTSEQQGSASGRGRGVRSG